MIVLRPKESIWKDVMMADNWMIWASDLSCLTLDRVHGLPGVGLGLLFGARVCHCLLFSCIFKQYISIAILTAIVFSVLTL